ncbi:MAG: complex I subunit 5 family protein [Campylobacterota bacterium]
MSLRICGVVLFFLPPLLFALLAPEGFSFVADKLFLGMHFHLSANAKIFITFTSLIYLAAALYSVFSVTTKVKRYWLLFALTYFGNYMLFLSADAISFYLFFSLMSFAVFGLIMHDQSSSARRAAVVYIVFAFVGEILLFLGIMQTIFHYDSTLFADFGSNLPLFAQLCLLLGFGIKTGVFVLHMWLPLAHSAAPGPVSAVLSGVMLKTGVFGWIVFLPLAHGHDQLGLILTLLGFLGIFGGLYGLGRPTLKQILAYSSLSQMGYLVMFFGLILQNPQLYTEAALFAVCFFCFFHALSKASLFLFADILLHGGKTLLTLVLSTVALLLLSGFAFSSGAVAKDMLKSFIDHDFLAILFAAGSFVTALLGARFFFLALQLPRGKNTPAVWIPASLLGFALVLAPVYGLAYEFSLLHFIPAVTAAALFGWLYKTQTQLPVLPEGDILTLFTQRK